MRKQLHLVLKHKWYAMIASGVKREEYRMPTEYWSKRLTYNGHEDVAWKLYGFSKQLKFKEYDSVVFHDGYTSTTQEYEIIQILFGKGDPKLGAPDHSCFIIRLGNPIRSTRGVDNASFDVMAWVKDKFDKAIDKQIEKVAGDFERTITHLCRVHNQDYDSMLLLLGLWVEQKRAQRNGRSTDNRR